MARKELTRAFAILTGAALISYCATQIVSVNTISSHAHLEMSLWIFTALICLGITIRFSVHFAKPASGPKTTRYVPTSSYRN